MVQLLKNEKQLTISTRIEKVFWDMFDNISHALEEIDGTQLQEQRWTRDKKGEWIQGENNNGIYIDRALRNGKVFEKVGLNYVSMQGQLPSGICIYTRILNYISQICLYYRRTSF